MVAQQELVHLEVERLASIGYANNKRKEAINTASFFLNYFLINVLIIFPAISLSPLPLLLVMVYIKKYLIFKFDRKLLNVFKYYSNSIYNLLTLIL